MSKKRRKTTGLPPGAIVFTGKQQVTQIAVQYVEYNEKHLRQESVEDVSIKTFHAPNEEVVQWYDVRGLHDVELIVEIGKVFSVHSLVLEDIVDTNQRPKLEETERGVFVTMKSLGFSAETMEVTVEHVAFYLGDAFLLTFQEKEEDLFLVIRNRIEKSAGKIRCKTTDYLLYALLDFLVDRYFVVLEEIEEVIESLELRIVESHSNQERAEIFRLKREVSKIRKNTTPLREMLHAFINSDSPLKTEGMDMYLRDLKDHTFHVVELAETYRENLNSLQDLLLSELGHRTNSVMQVLTIVSSIFIPLTFLAGIYGMNFKNIPELHYQNGYFVLVGVMLVIAVGLLYFFRRKSWL
ncbi:MAG: magnesium transporter [Neolewinella sp.]|jgi:magnesium transporter